MRIGISIPNNWGVADPCRLVNLAVRAEAAGLASVWTSEHLVNTSYVRERIGDRPYHHPLTILSAIAARTRRIMLGTSVLVLPFHNPLDLAKYAATLDQLSGGRLVLGVGVGNVPEEFEALGVPWARRGAITDEAIDVLRAVWADGPASHRGSIWSFDGIHTSPKPARGRRLPIWIGGMSAAARRRAIRVGDGWHPTAISPEELRQQADELKAQAITAGRDPAEIEICMRFNIALDDMPVTEAESLSTIGGYDAARAMAVAEGYRRAGATHFIFALNGHDPDILETTMDALARDLLPEFHDGDQG